MYVLNYQDFLEELNNIYFVGKRQYYNNGNGWDIPTLQLNYYIINNIYKRIPISHYTDTQLQQIKFPSNSVFYFYHPIVEDSEYEMQVRTKMLEDNLRNNNHKIIRNLSEVNSKKLVHKKLNSYNWMIKGVFCEEDINKIGYPLVAKIDGGHSGIGIKKIKSESDLKKDINKYDLFTEYIDYKTEFRSIYYKGNLLYIAERIPKKETNIDINNKDSNSLMDFVYIAQDIKKIPFLKELDDIVTICRNTFRVLEIFSIDFFLTKDNKLKVIEINSMTGLDPYRLLILYEFLYKDIFKMDVTINKKRHIDELKDIFLYKQYKEYKKEIDNSMFPIKYNISKNLLNLNLMNKIESLDMEQIKIYNKENEVD